MNDIGQVPTIPSRVPFAERAYRDLKHRILHGRLAAGHQATEQEIADLLSMSRTPVREALVRLAGDGLVEVRARHGMRVLPVTAADIREIYQVLLALEPEAAALAARNGASEETLNVLDSAMRNMEQALEKDDLGTWAENDRAFHVGLVAAARNKRLEVAAATVSDQIHRVRLLTVQLRPRPLRSNEEHRAVVAAIIQGDAETARACHRAHIERAGQSIIDILDSGLEL